MIKRYAPLKGNPPAADLRQSVYFGSLRPFHEIGNFITYKTPIGDFWSPYSAHTLHVHDPPKPFEQLEIEIQQSNLKGR